MAIKIYIDQGHNPVNPNAGAEGNGYREQDLVFRIGQLLSQILTREGFETRLSRPTSDTQLGNSVSSSLAARVDGANSWGADYFVSLHTNASVNPAANGAEVLVYSTSSPAFELARSVLEQLTLSTGVRGRGVVSRPGLYVLRKTAMPAILVEMGFITNPADASLMANSPELFAEGIANGIIDYIFHSEPASSGTTGEIAVFNDIKSNERDSDFAKDDEEDIEDNEYETLEDFMEDNNREGQLRIQAYRGQRALPLIPKFKVGDRIKHKRNNSLGTVALIDESFYHCAFSVIPICEQDDWELVPNKFDISTLKPFDKVLVRDNNTQKWVISFFSRYNNLAIYKYSCINGNGYAQCIPYEQNEHLLGTTNDCDEFYKTWE